MPLATPRKTIFLLLVCALLPLPPGVSRADILKTTDPAVAAVFMAGATLENFDDLTAFPLSSYARGQTIPASATFNTRNGATAPTFNSGGGTFDDPIGNPGTPIGIFDPQGSIASDFRSPNNVAGPLVVNDPTEPFNNGFMEVFFVDEVARVGFWVTHGTLMLNVFDNTGGAFGGGDTTVTAVKGEFVGIDRGAAEIKLISILPDAGADAITIDDLVWSSETQIEPPNQRLAYVGQVKNLVGGINNLDQPQSLATSPDGENVYALGGRDDSLLVFRRDAHTGLLTLLESHVDGVSGVDGLDFPVNVLVSPDGANVYVTASENTIASFTRDPADGSLSFLQVLRDGVGPVTGINQPFGLEISPGGEHVYVAGHVSQAIVTFDRDSVDGSLQFSSSITEGILDANELTDQLCMSPDGSHVYFGGFFKAVGVYSRDHQTGSLGFVELENFAETTSDCIVSPDGAFVYVAGGNGGRVEILSRNSMTGAITPISASVNLGTHIGRVQLSADGRNLYAHSGGDDFFCFERDAGNGSLRFIEKVENGVSGVDGIGGFFATGQALVPSPDGRHVYMSGSQDDAIGIFSGSIFRPAGFVQEGVDGIIDALGEPVAVAITPDGRFAYVAGRSSDTVAAFEIDRSNVGLVFIERKKLAETETANGLPIMGIDGASALSISPDGNQLYATGENDGAVVWFDLNTDGSLTYRNAYFDSLLAGAIGVTVTNDGAYVIATGQNSGWWATFERMTDGSLVPIGGAPSASIPMPGGIVPTPDDNYMMIAEASATGGGVGAFVRTGGPNFDGNIIVVDTFDCGAAGNQVEMSGDGRQVYVTCAASMLSADDGIYIVDWDDTTETLTPISQQTNIVGGALDSAGGAWGLSISDDDRFVAVAGPASDGYAIFARDAMTGDLSLAQKELEAVQSGSLGLAGATDLAFTPYGQALVVVGGGVTDGTVSLFVPEPGLAGSLLAGVLGVIGISRARRGSARDRPIDA